MLDAAVPPARTAVSTPGWLVRSMMAIVVIAALAAVGSLWAASAIRDAAQTIGRDAEPSVALALRMTATLGDMDAAALGDSLTDNGAAIGTSLRFRQDTDQLAADVVEASRNITYGEAEAAPLRELQRMLAFYEQAVVEARYLGGGDPWITSRRVQWASRVDRDMAVPQAEALATANADELERHYAAYRSTSLVLGAVVFVAYALLVAALVGVQLWLARRVRRWVNPLLAAATLVAGLCGLWFGAAVLSERAALRAAKADAYDSLSVLFQAKSSADALRADMSLWLLDPSVRTQAQARMDASAHALIGVDLGQPEQLRPLREALGRSLALERSGSATNAMSETPHPGGLLGRELDNITFGVAEWEAAIDSVARLVDAAGLVRAMQAQEGRDHTLTVGRWLSERPDGGGGAFGALQAALDRTIAVNQAEFDRRVTSALGTAGLIPVVTSGALALVALLSIGGLWLRLREYR